MQRPPVSTIRPPILGLHVACFARVAQAFHPHLLLLQLGSDQTVAELKAVEEHAKKYGHCSVVTRPDWLRECLRERQLLPVSQELTVSTQELAQMVSQQAAAAQAAAVAPPPQVGCAVAH